METDDQRRSNGSPPPTGTVPERLVGQVFANRYRLVRLLSEGANTVIYDADDLTSQRSVTLKVVQPDLAVTSTFRDRFDATIRGVAAISHPNIAAIFDWGEARFGDAHTMFVVIERLTAGSLRDMYDRGRRLSPSQALAVGLEACRGLDHAHRRGYVHGELTPSKLVFGDDRRLRIVDFGLAGMLAERQWEEPSSLATHVARYASPEQALSLPIDGTTDVYALCLTLVEGVTGVLPFAADSTVATLAARVGRLMPVSADLGPLASVLERAGRPEAAERSTAAQFGRSLVQAAEKLPRPEPLPLLSTGLFETPPDRLRDPADPTGGVERPADLVIALSEDEPGDQPAEQPVDQPSDQPVDQPGDEPGQVDQDGSELRIVPAVDHTGEVGGARPAPEFASDVTPEPSAPAAETGPHGTERLDLVVLDVEAVPPVSSAVASAAPADHRTRRRGRRVAWVVVVPLLVLAVLGGMVFAAIQLFSTPSYDVPDLTGVDQSAALAQIDDFGWDLQIDNQRSDDEPRPDHVIRTVPAAGERLAEGEPFLMVVSEGPVLRVLPELVGLGVGEAVATLEELALDPVVQEAFDEVVAPGTVVSWTVTDAPELVAGGEVEPGTEVVVVESLGPEPRTVPDLSTSNRADAVTTLAELGLRLVIEEDFSDEVPEGDVVSQDPPAGEQVERDTEVTLTFSLGPDLVVLPDLTGLTFTEAREIVADAGLELVLAFGASDGEFVSASVEGEPVEAGDEFPRGTQVDSTFL